MGLVILELELDYVPVSRELFKSKIPNDGEDYYVLEAQSQRYYTDSRGITDGVFDSVTNNYWLRKPLV